MNNVHIVTLSAYTKPEIKEEKNKDFVSYGKDNLYFDYLIDRYVNSTTHQAVIDGKSRLIFGKGLWATDANEKIENFANFKAMLRDEDCRRAVVDRVMLGMAAILITKDKGKTKLTHWPMETLRAGKAEDGDIKTWYYHPNWKERRQKSNTDDLEKFPVFDPESKAKEQILIIKPYVPGFYYYPPVSYSGGIPYTVMEEEIADYLINDVKNGFSGTKVVNFNNGVPTEEEQKKTVDQANKKLQGARGLKVIYAFNKDETKKTTVDDIPLNDAPDHYRYLSEECEAKILKAHKAPSELLGFKNDSAGFANNAEELKNKMIAFDNYELIPYKIEIIDAIDQVLSSLDMSFNLYFKGIEPLEFVDNKPLTLSMDPLRAFIAKGESLSDEWEIIDKREVDYEMEADFDDQVSEWETLAKQSAPKLKKNWIQRLVSTGTARTNVKSEQDEQIGDYYYRVRYRYVGNPLPQRPFCVAMMAADKLYRKEDIIALDQEPVNPGWGPNGTDKYSIWKYKGGGNCYHRWQRVTFRNTSRFQSIDPSDQISNAQARRDGMDTREEDIVTKYPRYSTNRGFLPGNPQGNG